MIKKPILLFLTSTEFNDEEYLTIRANFEKNGFSINIASDAANLCLSSKGLRVKADILLYNIHAKNFASLVLIGGSGMRNYWSNILLQKVARGFFDSGIPVGAICSAPVLLANAGLLKGIEAVCFPSDRKVLEKSGTTYVDKPVVKSGKIITGRDPQSALDFSWTVLNILES